MWAGVKACLSDLEMQWCELLAGLLLVVVASFGGGFAGKDDGRYPIKNKLHLFAALSEVGNWESLCTNLGVSDSLMEALRFSDKNNMLKKEECLKHFYNDDPDWGHVVNTVAEFPISNPTLACKIAKKFMDMDKKECRAFLGERDDDEL